jgi:predicted RNase H-like nuclease (RuvC/YqgF family)
MEDRSRSIHIWRIALIVTICALAGLSRLLISAHQKNSEPKKELSVLKSNIPPVAHKSESLTTIGDYHEEYARKAQEIALKIQHTNAEIEEHLRTLHKLNDSAHEANKAAHDLIQSGDTTQVKKAQTLLNDEKPSLVLIRQTEDKLQSLSLTNMIQWDDLKSAIRLAGAAYKDKAPSAYQCTINTDWQIKNW